jgi:hypothetical protein
MRNLTKIKYLSDNIDEMRYTFKKLHKNLLTLGHFGAKIEHSSINEMHAKIDQFKHQIEDQSIHAHLLMDSFD